jgi:hypothetical protein
MLLSIVVALIYISVNIYLKIKDRKAKQILFED